MPERAATQLAKHRFHYRQVLNWESPLGIPDTVFLRERPENGRNYGNSFTANAFERYSTASNFTDDVAKAYAVAQPSRHAMFYAGGMVKNADLCWHMDNGNHPRVVLGWTIKLL